MAEPTAQATERQDSVKLNWTQKSIEVAGKDIWNVLIVSGIALALYGGWQHAEAAKDGQKAVVEAVKEANQTNVQLVRAMQEANCLNRLTPEQKKKFEEVDWCRKVGQGKAF